MITKEFFKEYMVRCISVDGYVVMKSNIPFKIGEPFGGARSFVLGGTINGKMIVADAATVDEAVEQAKKCANVTLLPADRKYKYYYRVVPEGAWRPYMDHKNQTSEFKPFAWKA